MTTLSLLEQFFSSCADRRAVLAGAVGLGGLALLPSHSSAETSSDSVGHVGYLRGGATATRAGAARDLADKSALFVADLIETRDKTRMMLALGKRTTLKIGANAKVRIESYLLDAGGDIELAAGAIQFERTGPPAATELRFKSPYGLIAVRGTRFFAGPSKGVFGVLVGSGRVEVSAGGATVSVGPGQGTDIARPGARPSKAAKWGDARIEAALRSIR